MTEEARPQLEEAIEHSVTEALAGLNGAGTPEMEKHLASLLLGEYQTAWARQEAQRILSQETAPDFTPLMKTAWDIRQEVAKAGPLQYLIEQVLPVHSTAILVAATNSGGSTLQTHLAACVLTSQPLLGTFPVNVPENAVVLWINPEEAEEEPEERLKKMGLKKADMERFRHLHTRQHKLYLNQPQHVTALIDGLEKKGWLDGRPTLLIVDGFTPTLSGDAWNKDLEAWKEGMGRLIAAVKPISTVVRAQVHSGGARYSKGKGEKSTGENLNAEDVIGGQLAQWPDQRLVINRLKDSDARRLTVRGRRAEEWSITYDWDSHSWTPKAVEVGQELKASMILTQVMGEHHRDGRPLPPKVRALARYLVEEAEAQGMADPPSVESFRRAISASQWAWHEEAEQWTDKALLEASE